jgi:perosamine synthetase
MTGRVPIAGPWITEKEVQYVADAVAHAWYENASMYHDRFEKAFREHLGVAYAMALPSCTAAIHLSLAALGIGPGDEVIVPDITWIASAAPVTYVGATPVFADIDERTWCLSAAAFERCITPRTRAVIPVDLYGGMPDMDAIVALARRRNIAVIEDAAQAAGGLYKGRPAGSLGDVGVFSFHGSKTLTTGEGGMLVTNRRDVYDRATVLRDHGRIPGEKMFWNGEVAYKYKMSSMQAALGLAQLERLEELIARKREAFAWYREELDGVAGVILNAEAEGTRNVYWMVTVILDATLGIEKEPLMAKLKERGIASRPFFYPLSSLPAYAGQAEAERARQRNRVSYALSPWGVNLPSALSLSREQVRRVCDVLEEILSAERR